MTSLRKKGKYGGDANRMGEMAAARQGCDGTLAGGGRQWWLLGLQRAAGLLLDLRTGTREP
jgi:hypothetical protein